MIAMGQVAVLGPALTVRVMAVAVLTLVSKEIKVITTTRVVTTSKVIRGPTTATVWLSEQPEAIE